MPHATLRRSIFRSAVVTAAMTAIGPGGCGARTGLPAPAGEGGAREACGNHVVDAGEECDDGNQVETDGCLATCVRARCGDGIRAVFEACDDGNDVDTDACKNDCTIPTCGDGVVQPPEECDDPDRHVCSPLCRLPRCGDGFIDPGVEACDLGAANEDRPAIFLINEATTRPVKPVRRSVSPETFYAYQSESAHTGFEALHTSKLFLFQETAVPGLSLFTFHGIDLDSTGLDEGDGQVDETISGLPPGTSVLFADEKNELSMAEPGVALGHWKYHHNTDGGIIGGIPFPGSWRIQVDADFIQSITAWQYVDGDAKMIDLEGQTAVLQTFDTPSKCRTDCTIPRCGDGILDGGEVCDDGNTVSGDGCAADCATTD